MSYEPLGAEDIAAIRSRHGILHRCLWGNQEDAIYVMGDRCDAIRALDAYEYAARASRPDTASEYGRLLAERDRLVKDGADPSDLLVPEPPARASRPEPKDATPERFPTAPEGLRHSILTDWYAGYVEGLREDTPDPLREAARTVVEVMGRIPRSDLWTVEADALDALRAAIEGRSHE